jgi:lysine 2,3-aminomutase
MNGTAAHPPQRAPARDKATFPISERSEEFRRRHFPDATREEWNDWHWQLRHRLRDRESLERVFLLNDDEQRTIDRIGGRLAVGITPYYAALMSPDDPDEPLRKTMIPVADEFFQSRGEAEDPLGEDAASPVPGIVHRYPDRVLFLVTSFCAVYCRYCTRARHASHPGEYHFHDAQYERAMQ